MKLIPLPHRPNSVAAAVSAILSLAAASAAQAGPQDGVVTGGSATISTPSTGLTQIDQLSRVVSIDWRSFDLAANETVRFNQPSTSAVALNRINTQDPSLILGTISANGRVFLLNPNGIIFGESARVNVGSLVASSLDLTGWNASSGRYSFSSSATSGGAIVNNGSLTAADGGSVTLLGRSVSNNGLIVANYGTVNLGAGSAATLNFDADGLVRLRLGAGDAAAAVSNAGEISATGGQVLLTARQASDAVTQAVNNSGVIRAVRIDNTGGRIRLVGEDGAVVNSGTLDVSSADDSSTGGEVQVLGRSVELAGSTRVDASGSTGGGTVLIGGGFGGADPSVINARETVVRAGAEIRANSTRSGDAGRVAVWSDGTTRFSGDVQARAGGADGNGGFVEVSGREHLAIDGHASLQSRNGSAGTLLLDPGAVNIVHGTDDVTAENDVFTDGWIADQLAGSNLTISTAASDSANPAQDLTVEADADLDWADTTLTLIGADSVTLQAGSQLAGSGTGALVLQSGGGVAIDSAITLGGDLTVTAGGPITQAGTLDVGGTADLRTLNDGGAAITLDGTNNFGTVNASVRNAADTANANATITIREASATTLGTVNTAGNLDVTSTGAIGQSGVLTVNGNSTFQAGNGASITLGNVANTFGGTLGFSSTGTLQDVTIADSSALDLQALTIAGNLMATSGGAITQSGALNVAGTARFRTRSDAGAGITLAQANNFGVVYAATRDAADNTNANATITLNEASSMALGDIDTAGAAALSSGGAITQLAGTDVTAASLSLTAGGDIGSAANPLALAAANMAVAATSAGSLYLQNTGTLRLSGIQANGTAAIGAGGSILDDASASTIVANALVLNAAGSIGEAIGSGNGPLEVQAQSVAANAQGGGIHLDATSGNLNLRQVSAAGPVWLRAASGSLTDDAVDPQAASVTSGAGGVSLLARDNIGTVTDLATRQGSALQVDTNGGVLNAQVTSATGQVNLLLGAGTAPTFGTLSAGGAGRLLLQSPGNLSLGAMGGSVTGFTQVGFSADGVLTLPSTGLLGGSPDLLLLRGGTDIASAGRVLNLNAGNLVFSSGGQGGATTLNTTVNRLDATLGNGASLAVNNSTALTLGAIAAGGNLSIQAADLLDDGDAGSVTRVSAGGTLSLTSGAGIGRQEGSSGGRIDTAGGTLVLQAGAGSAFVSSNGNLQVSGTATGGSIDIAAPAGNITVNGALNATGDVTLSAGSTGTAGNILLNGTVQAGQAANLTALGGGNISDADATVRLIAADANLQASSIGTATNALNATLTSLQANATTRINVDLSGGAQLRAISAPTVTINAVGNLVDDGNASTRVVGQDVRLSGAALGTAGSEIGTAAATLSLNATGGGIYVRELDAVTLADVTAAGAGNDIVLLAGGAISDDGVATTRISGGNLTLAGSALGEQGDELQTQVAALTATTTGGLYISEADDLQLNAITADRIRISTSGELTDDGNDSTRLTASAVTLIAQSVGTAGSRIDTATGTLSIGSGSAGAFVDELDSVTLAGIDVAGDGTFALRANGAITDADATGIAAARLELTAASIGTTGNALDTAVGSLTASTTAGGLFIDNTGNLAVDGLSATGGAIGVRNSGALQQVDAISSDGGAISLRGETLTMHTAATTRSAGGNITYLADGGDVTLGVLDAGSGRALVIARDGVYSALGSSSGLYNLTGSLIEVRAGGLGATGQIGTAGNEIEINASGHGPRSIFLVVPAANGTQTSTPRVNLPGGSSSVLLLKGFAGTTGALLLDPSTAFTQDAVVQGGESIVPLLNGRVAVNADSLGAASQAQSSGAVTRVDVDWSAFDPDVSLFSTVGPSVRVPDDQVDEAAGP